jgi:antitoxin HicB
MTPYLARVEPDDAEGGFVVTLSGFDWGVTQAETLAEALAMAQALLIDILQHLIRRGEDIPAPRRQARRKLFAIPLPPLAAAKIELYRLLRQTGTRKSELARRMGISKTNIDRLFDLTHASRMELLDAAFHALGKQLVIEVRDLAA